MCNRYVTSRAYTVNTIRITTGSHAFLTAVFLYAAPCDANKFFVEELLNEKAQYLKTVDGAFVVIYNGCNAAAAGRTCGQHQSL